MAEQVHSGDEEEVGHAHEEGGEVAQGADHIPDVPAKFEWCHETLSDSTKYRLTNQLGVQA